MSPTSIGIVLLVGILQVCSGKRSDQRLEAVWWESMLDFNVVKFGGKEDK